MHAFITMVAAFDWSPGSADRSWLYLLMRIFSEFAIVVIFMIITFIIGYLIGHYHH